MPDTAFTILFHIQLKCSKNENKEYIFTSKTQDHNITAYTCNSVLFFEAFSFNPLRNDNRTFNIQIPFANLDDKKTILTFEHRKKKEEETLCVFTDCNKRLEETFTSLKHPDDPTSLFFSIGGSDSNNNFGHFKLFETVAYNKSLNMQELQGLINYLKKKNSLNHTLFNGSSFIYRDLKTGSLVQHDSNRQPKHVDATK